MNKLHRLTYKIVECDVGFLVLALNHFELTVMLWFFSLRALILVGNIVHRTLCSFCLLIEQHPYITACH